MVPPHMAQPLRQAVDTILQDRRGITLESYLDLARGKDKPDSFEVIARAVHRDTGVLVSWNTIRRWVDISKERAS